MKTIWKLVFWAALLAFQLTTTDLSADPPTNPPPLPGGGHGGGNNQPPSGAPIDGGLGVLLFLGTALAGSKIMKNRNNNKSNP
jgi:hypothetical protein